MLTLDMILKDLYRVINAILHRLEHSTVDQGGNRDLSHVSFIAYFHLELQFLKSRHAINPEILVDLLETKIKFSRVTLEIRKEGNMHRSQD